jgi:hypothetical protein
MLPRQRSSSEGTERKMPHIRTHVHSYFRFYIYIYIYIYIDDHVPYFFKSKLNSSQHDVIKSKSTVTNLVTFLVFITPLVCSQGQTDSIYFDFSNGFDILPHSLLLHKLSNYGLSCGYLNWFLSYFNNRQSCVRFLVYFRRLLSRCQAYLKDQF